MNSYLPETPLTAAEIVAILVAELIVGFVITRIERRALSRAAAWLLVTSAVGGVLLLTDIGHPGFRMLAIIAALLFGMKAVVAVEATGRKSNGAERLGFIQWLAFAGWFGMRPAPFLAFPGPSLPEAGTLMRNGAANLTIGLLFIVTARAVWTATDEFESGRRIAATVLLLPGLSLMLHFGLFNIVAGVWRRLGVDCRRLFRSPLMSTSLHDFWSRRWNLGFVEMTALGIFRPAASLLNPRVAGLTAFFVSGLLHELAISVPVDAGYGLPLLYFLLHGVALEIERTWKSRLAPAVTAVVLGRLWTAAWILLPLPLLFHVPFLNGIVWPLIGMG